MSRSNAVTVVAVLTILAAVGGGVTVVDGAGPTTVAVDPPRTEAAPGSVAAADIVVNSTSGGIGGHSTRIVINGTNTSEFVRIEPRGDPSDADFEVVNRTRNRTVVEASAFGMDTDDSGQVTIATVVLRTRERNGTTRIEPNVLELSDEQGGSYQLGGQASGLVRVAERPAIGDAELNLPSQATANVGGRTTVNVTATGTNRGISSYRFEANLSDIRIATVDDVDLVGADRDDPFTDVTIQNDKIAVSVSNVDIDGGRIATVTLLGRSRGTADFNFTNVSGTAGLRGDSANPYRINTSNGTEVQIGSSDPADLTQSVELRPATGTVRVGGTERVDIQFVEPVNGVDAYDISVGVNDTSRAEITGASVVDTLPPDAVADTTVAIDGSSVSITAQSNADHDAGRLASVTVQGVSTGAVDTTVNVESITAATGESYQISSTSNTSVFVEGGPPKLRNAGAPPDDPDGDGLYEDVDGSGGQTEPTILDVIALLDAFEDDPAVTNNPSAFNFDEGPNDTVNILDVIALLEQV